MQLCDCHNGAGCNPSNGICECLVGWSGQRCDTPCPEGYFGTNCTEQCSCENGTQCDPADGECICQPGFRGKSCELRKIYCDDKYF
ncbi:unnamed protein product [Gongylonema pulchrum]|uniref:EGF-like domain-containing protein n=1 Tax=Gongylonema pulchrum TaxID=637853 RepID=A0A183D244_9BILA|nr:unnamed protein product [Gongylonema pulchrum]